MRAALYTRVSTTDQNAEMQVRELNVYVARQGWDVFATYQDVMSGAKSNRPGLTQLMADARMRRFDVLLCWKLDRFGRSLVACLNNIQELERCGIRESTDSGTDPGGTIAVQARFRDGQGWQIGS